MSEYPTIGQFAQHLSNMPENHKREPLFVLMDGTYYPIQGIIVETESGLKVSLLLDYPPREAQND